MPQSAIPSILSLLTFLPLVGAIVVMCLPRPADLPDDHHGGHGDDEHGEPKSHSTAPAWADDPARMIVNWTALGFVVLNFLVSIALFVSFKSGYINNSAGNAMQFM